MTHILGNISIDTFLTEYWQKKPLLIKNGMPQIAGLLEPDDIKELALEEDIQARLLMQNPKNAEQWRVKKSPFVANDLKKLPPLHTLLVQAVDHWSLDVANLWQAFDFIPQWRRDDVMVSYAPAGGSVGRHFDQYDVFLVQGYGSRRWQLGQWCDNQTALVPDQPLRLLPEMQDIFFDEVLEVGDVLYVPPKLAHYGVAVGECLTYSFGFRMPNAAQLLERVVDHVIGDSELQAPLQDYRTKTYSAGLISTDELEALRLKLIESLKETLQDSDSFTQAILPLLSESRDPDNLPEGFGIAKSELKQALQSGATLQREPAGRLIYLQQSASLEFWWNGEEIEVPTAQQSIAQKFADGLVLDQSSVTIDNYEFLTDWIGEGRIILNEME
ncbi:JmjC domain-containing protein [Aquirhabdus sp.]|uniref:JmjC domain-containing protein n=1 Tax=Aquirhabdus sp. TaxID=2824160 RepID=UPI00396C2D91